MENNRRSFFKGLAVFASGVVAAKAATYIPKKEEKKETVFVPSTLTIHHEGKDYHPLVVEKADRDTIRIESTIKGGDSLFSVSSYKNTIRKANI